jgi:hypothetical protein
MPFGIKSLFGEKEKQHQFESKDRARILAKRIDRQKSADLNSHQHGQPGGSRWCIGVPFLDRKLADDEGGRLVVSVCQRGFRVNRVWAGR